MFSLLAVLQRDRQVRHLLILRRPELCLQCLRLRAVHQFVELLGNLSDELFFVAGALDERDVPGRLCFETLHRQVNRATCNQRSRILYNWELSQVKGDIVGADKFLDPLKEPQRRRKRDAEVETPQNFVFHLEDVRLGDGLVRGHLEHLYDRRRVDFFVLDRDEEGA